MMVILVMVLVMVKMMVMVLYDGNVMFILLVKITNYDSVY